MPYTIVQGSGARPWKIKNRNTGEIVGTSLTKQDAEKSVRARLAGDHGWKAKKGRGG